MRFTVRKATKGWMVWDNDAGRVAVVDDYQAIDLSAETAAQFAAMLNRLHGQIERLKRSGAN